MDFIIHSRSGMLLRSVVKHGYQKTEQKWCVVVVSGTTWITEDRTEVVWCVVEVSGRTWISEDRTEVVFCCGQR